MSEPSTDSAVQSWGAFGGAEGGLVGGHGHRPVDGIVQPLVTCPDVQDHVVQC